MTFGAWNVRTTLDREENACPERKTAILAREISCYNIDVASLSETHLSDEEELVEHGGGCTFFWKELVSPEPRRSGVGFAVKNYLAAQLQECPVHVSDRITTTLLLYMERKNYPNFISIDAPTLDKSDEI
ncbi:unnamed protein product [Parnassius apollo]|uniref:(apollo) hypothetical protein n=1 Tax=Parnassius apollo TaxID=110799 RepID=A0A8S3XFG1_PARAO|nr:unnamed protein product [Parnassius apollo]